MTVAVLGARATRDLATRQALFAGEPCVEVPADGRGFWEWYAGAVCGTPAPALVPVDAEAYPAESRGPALWFSGGVESTYTLQLVQHENPTLLHIEDYDLFSGPHRAIGQIHFLCAVTAASMGYGPVYMGIERADLLPLRGPRARGYVERNPVFAARWSEYQPQHAVRTLCADLHKEEIILRLQGGGARITGTCDRNKDGTWCRDCYKCFEAYYTAKAVGVDLGYRLTRRGFDAYHAEYRRYVDSDFEDNFNNAYQHYVRLQITYGLRFEPDQDCA